MKENLQKFTAPIVCEISNDGKSYTLKKGFYYYRADGEWEEYQSECGETFFMFEKERIVVPAGFTSDGFTNYGLDFIVPRFGKGLKCAILHDYLCEGFHSGQNTRRFADEIFLEAMLETKAFSKAKAYLLYFAVRFFARIKGYK